MNRRTILSLAIILLAVASVGGATMAWFTDSKELTNTFSAGTLEIDGSDHWTGYDPGDVWENVNPGDCKDKEFTIYNKGSKHALLRFTWNGVWSGVKDAGGNPLTGDPDLVSVKVTGWTSKVDPVTNIKWWYYDGKLDPSDPDDPGYPNDSYIEFTLEVCLAGAGTGNEYQGASFKLDFDFEAIQASNNASGDQWGVDSWYFADDGVTPSDPTNPAINPDLDRSATNWAEFNFTP